MLKLFITALQLRHLKKINMDKSIPFMQNLVWLKGDWCYPSDCKETEALLRECLDIQPPQSTCTAALVKEVKENSDSFPIPFPVQNVRLYKLEQIEPDVNQTRNIMSTYPLIHERVLLLMASFIIYMREFGTLVEKNLYKNMTIPKMIDRMLLKRSVTFCGAKDLYQLLSGEVGQDGWESVGTTQESPPLTLDNCLSYNEMRLSAMLFVSGHTAFINDGSRHNEANLQQQREREGVIVGLIGTRFERKLRMEYEECIISEQQNRLERGYGEEVSYRTCLDVLRTTYMRDDRVEKSAWRQMWSEFFQVPSHLYEEHSPQVARPTGKRDFEDRFVHVPNSSDIFDNEVYYKRLSIPFECALLEADSRAAEDDKMAYLNIVGIGLGVWRVSSHQTDVFVLSFVDRVRSLLSRGLLNHVSDVNFAYIQPSDDIKEMLVRIQRIDKTTHPSDGITLTQVNREPSSELVGEHAGKLLVTTYAWDGNAHPGNEFWMGNLSSSGDPAAACSSQVAELHNAHINRRYVRAANTRVCGQHGLRPLADYCRLLLGE